jgi:hypothetical protein
MQMMSITHKKQHPQNLLIHHYNPYKHALKIQISPPNLSIFHSHYLPPFPPHKLNSSPPQTPPPDPPAQEKHRDRKEKNESRDTSHFTESDEFSGLCDPDVCCGGDRSRLQLWSVRLENGEEKKTDGGVYI